MQIISLLDTSICTKNMGDHIIMNAIKDELQEIFPHSFFTMHSTHDYLKETSYKLIRNSDLTFVCGTNLLSSKMNSYNQWKINLKDITKLKRVILLGVGWWQYQDSPNLYTRILLRKILNKNYIHSVRDEYTKNKLASIGVKNVINTSCPSMWKLSNEHLSSVPHEKGNIVITTLTDYSPNEKADKSLLELLKEKYKKVFLWIQGVGDFDWFKHLNVSGIDIVGPHVIYYDEILRSEKSIDYVGTRLHAGIRALSFGKRTIICGVDNRAIEMGRDFRLSVVNRDDTNSIKTIIERKISMDVIVPIKKIVQWKQQFYGSLPM
jgi:polysaccharide pyruvyl transferase WcaK-like protein